ncbi:hypothetical protein ACJX0J_031827, partial [Zea mays]
IDGIGLGLVRHHERLAKMFDLWCLHIPVEDRTPFAGTPFAGLVEYVERAVKSESSRAPDRPIYLVGESVGACVALAVAARNPGIDLVLILVNPGTSFHRSQLQTLSAFLDLVPEPFHLTTPQLLNFLTGNLMKMPEAFVGRGLSLQEAGPRLSETTSSMLDSLTILVDVLTKESIVCKLEMLKASSSFVNSRLHAVKAQTLVLASGNDELLPSTQEAERLRGALEKCRTRVFRDNGHKILLEAGFDLATTIKGAGYYRRTRRTDFVADYIPPTPDELQQAIDHDRYACCFQGEEAVLLRLWEAYRNKRIPIVYIIHELYETFWILDNTILLIYLNSFLWFSSLFELMHISIYIPSCISIIPQHAWMNKWLTIFFPNTSIFDIAMDFIEGIIVISKDQLKHSHEVINSLPEILHGLWKRRFPDMYLNSLCCCLN